MPSIHWLQQAFAYGYDSGNVLSFIPGFRRFFHERRIGGSYRTIFQKAILPYLHPNSCVLELGPGKGSWSKAILRYIPQGRLFTVDFQDVTPWLNPSEYHGRLVCYAVEENSFACIHDESIDFFWSFGVLCHNNIEHIRLILQNALPKMKRGGLACHQYGAWDKLNVFGWRKGKVPIDFKQKPDEEIWWPRNSRAMMQQTVEEAGWRVLNPDLNLVQRDGIILLQRME